MSDCGRCLVELIAGISIKYGCLETVKAFFRDRCDSIMFVYFMPLLFRAC